MSEQTRTIFNGKIIQLDIEQVTLPNGTETELEIVRHPGGVAVVLEDVAGRLCLLRQYRHVAGGWLWEFPAGKLEKNMDSLSNAKKEVLEETGATARHWQSLGSTISSPGVFTEKIELFYATDLTIEKHNHEEEEVIEIHWFDADEIHNMILSGEIHDAKTIIGYYLYRDKISAKS
jgi:8-oxo-dGTP pyrophosphatase MutT (NUDIX family)